MRSIPQNPWSPADERLLEQMWNGNKKCKDIMAKLGRTKGSVIGKVNRMALLSRENPVAVKRGPRPCANPQCSHQLSGMKRRNAKFCSEYCSQAIRRKPKLDKCARTECGKEFYLSGSHRRYCSRECSSIAEFQRNEDKREEIRTKKGLITKFDKCETWGCQFKVFPTMHMCLQHAGCELMAGQD